ncbi:hypothetical protein PV05_10775 [Exophiala xenobiotica]|uniref:BZIP domain-containing protein n=1 Tax=Exophiala xenobiotica TaxID=348802 RepID=A0A0D2BA28_9EURO|nr:uncharacterized protein PV05_10775 [Exophiala xenobiotica]KIW49061.1 hypothetical protein PV05_10775 [Exophiala xenobiotica]
MLTQAKDRVANRREQLRKAQKTFRERRDQYLKQLEQQVQRLQKTESDLQSQVDRLQHELSEATGRFVVADSKRNGTTQYLGQNDFPAGEKWESSTFISPDPNHGSVNGGSAVIWIENQNHKPWQMHVQLASPPPKDHPQWPLSPVSLESEITSSPQDGYVRQLENFNDNWADGHVQAGFSLINPSILQSSSSFVAQLDPVVVGMEFVLKLERPCLPHIHQPDGDQGAPHGHVHTATAALICSAHASPSEDLVSRRWNAPAEVLRRLLDISSSLPIEEGSEVTPIQVWHMISQGPDFSRMKVAHLVWMSDRLLRQIKCYGFGAVVTQDYLKKMLTEMRV